MKKTEGRWDEAERCRGDSVDSTICAWGTHIRMRYSNAHAVLPCSCIFLCHCESVLNQDDDLEKMP
jgi:hypothetical protein